MRLTRVRIQNFRSIIDSDEIAIRDVTCLVGKNESGKTALLQALYRLNPIIASEGNFDATDDYPRSSVSDYEEDVQAGRREQSEVVQAVYELDEEDISAVKSTFGTSCFTADAPAVTLTKGYGNELEVSDLDVDCKEALGHLIEVADLPQQVAGELNQVDSISDMVTVLSEAEQTEAVSNLTPILEGVTEYGLPRYIFDGILKDRLPAFLYFDEYYQMKGQDNLDALKSRLDTNTLDESDHPLLGLMDIAGLRIDELVNPGRTETLIARLEAAENRLTQKVLTYWSQNKHLRMKFDIRPAQPGDGADMTSGTNVLGRVEDTKHMVSTPLGTRSRGFVWFFSFLAWYSKLQREGRRLILLLDEPGLSLHGKAQGDLLHYFEEELKPHHQLLYTTHSPFMVDSRHFDRVRIVQDLSIEADSADLPYEQRGTKVLTDVLEATSDSLFPIQGALGYEIYQSLFVGPNSLVVEGVSDLLYIQTISALLQERGHQGLSLDWTITPVGGADKILTFVALMGAQSNLNIAVLVDYQKKDHQSIENLYKSKLLNKKKVITFADFLGAAEADVEDMFDPEFYLDLVNGEFGSAISIEDLTQEHPRILRRLEGFLGKSPLPDGVVFNHFRPARFLAENIGSLGEELNDETLDRFQRAFDALNRLL